jgi:N-acetylglucosaminyl-diphospho-decaprenol L-rhamnosyltransferase
MTPTISSVDIDVVVVAYRSAEHLRACVQPLCDQPGLNVIVVDNACPEQSLSTISDLAVNVVEMGRNAGFAAGCNAGAAAGSAGGILFLNPDAQIVPEAVRVLGDILERDPRCGAVGPRIIYEGSGETQHSMRRGPSVLAAFAEAFFLHHVFRHSDWATEDVRRGYDKPHSDPTWLIGAAICVRRAAFEQLGGWDERFFMYSEDTDLGTRLRKAGWVLWYEPAAEALHAGSASTPRSTQAVMRAEARVAYVRVHERGLRYLAFRTAFALHELLRVPIAATRSLQQARARLAALAVALSPPRSSTTR